MLELINIKKDYETGDTKVAALKGINLRFIGRVGAGHRDKRGRFLYPHAALLPA